MANRVGPRRRGRGQASEGDAVIRLGGRAAPHRVLWRGDEHLRSLVRSRRRAAGAAACAGGQRGGCDCRVRLCGQRGGGCRPLRLRRLRAGDAVHGREDVQAHVNPEGGEALGLLREGEERHDAVARPCRVGQGGVEGGEGGELPLEGDEWPQQLLPAPAAEEGVHLRTRVAHVAHTVPLELLHQVLVLLRPVLVLVAGAEARLEDGHEGVEHRLAREALLGHDRVRSLEVTVTVGARIVRRAHDKEAVVQQLGL
mmetsp:Transcript_18703/g.54829  ORF Transcript_18703/g.54829 Transcript_18703/m.54829 type:complete len:255 (-) Transcript_18703:893-1657(-)